MTQDNQNSVTDSIKKKIVYEIEINAPAFQASLLKALEPVERFIQELRQKVETAKPNAD